MLNQLLLGKDGFSDGLSSRLVNHAHREGVQQSSTGVSEIVLHEASLHHQIDTTLNIIN